MTEDFVGARCVEALIHGGPPELVAAGASLAWRAMRGLILLLEADTAMNVVQCERR